MPSSANFPYLASLIGGYFHQDFDLNGNTLEEIIETSKKTSSAEETAGTIADIQRFLATYGDSDARIATEFVRLFDPGIIAEGWEGLTTRQFLLKIETLLSST
jgi:hypothetical protein